MATSHFSFPRCAVDGYTSADIVYAWHPTKVGLEPGVELAQYDLVNVNTTDEQRIRRGSGTIGSHLVGQIGPFSCMLRIPQ